MPTSVTAFCPGHLSGYFSPVFGTDLQTTGSLGAGIVIHEGVTARVTRAETQEIAVRRFDSIGNVLVELAESPPISSLMERLPVTVRIETECRLPIGAGFGLSAAALVASALAVNVLGDLGLSPGECCELAHETEILNHTGLGDVAACQGGGRDYRQGPGLHAAITRYFDIHEPLYAVNFGPLPSPGILGSPEVLAGVSRAFPGQVPDTPFRFFDLSRHFAEESGLMTPEIEEVLDHCTREEVPATMTMLGNGVFSLGPKGGEVLSSYGEVYELQLAPFGPRITGLVP
jgi:pantoate kinase